MEDNNGIIREIRRIETWKWGRYSFYIKLPLLGFTIEIIIKNEEENRERDTRNMWIGYRRNPLSFKIC